MPDWTYHPIARPLLAPLSPVRRRELLLSAIEIVARLPGGRGIVQTFGDMRPPASISLEMNGSHLRSPIGLASGVDPLGTGRRALSAMGFGFLEIAVSIAPRVGGAIDVDERSRAIRPSVEFENVGLAATVTRLERRSERTAAADPAIVFRLVTDTATQVEDRLAEIAEMKAALDAYATAFTIDEDLASSFLDSRVVAVRLAVDASDEASLERVREARRTSPERTILAVTQGDTPAHALAAIDAGATLVAFEYGYVFSGPLLVKRTNDALASRTPPEADTRPAYARPWFWTLALGVALMAGGALAWLVAATLVVLPYDEVFLGWSRATLAAREPRLLHFMTHDRITLAGSMLSLGILYGGLALGDLRRGAPWAKRVVVVSAYFGMASYWLWLGFGYFDPLHALLTLIVLPFVVLTGALRLGPERPPRAIDLGESIERKRALVAQLLFVVTGTGFIIGGATIAWIGITTVFVPTDVVYLHAGLHDFSAVNPHLIPLVAHDRAGFGGDLFADGIAVVLTAMWGFHAGNRLLWWAIAIAAIPGFGAALGVHVAIGYLDPLHLAPPVTALVLYACGLWLSYPYLNRRRSG